MDWTGSICFAADIINKLISEKLELPDTRRIEPVKDNTGSVIGLPKFGKHDVSNILGQIPIEGWDTDAVDKEIRHPSNHWTCLMSKRNIHFAIFNCEQSRVR